jgi:hypothetical protein
MPKPIELPPAVAKAFVRDMRKFFKAKTVFDRDEIAAGTGWRLKQDLPKGTKLRITDVPADEGSRLTSKKGRRNRRRPARKIASKMKGALQPRVASYIAARLNFQLPKNAVPQNGTVATVATEPQTAPISTTINSSSKSTSCLR